MLAYCDKIADVVRSALLKYDPDNIIESVGNVKLDLHPTEGYMLSTKKSIEVADMSGKLYRVIVEEV